MVEHFALKRVRMLDALKELKEELYSEEIALKSAKATLEIMTEKLRTKSGQNDTSDSNHARTVSDKPSPARKRTLQTEVATKSRKPK